MFTQKTDVRSFVPISKCRSAFTWQDYSALNFALPIRVNQTLTFIIQQLRVQKATNKVYFDGFTTKYPTLQAILSIVTQKNVIASKAHKCLLLRTWTIL